MIVNLNITGIHDPFQNFNGTYILAEQKRQAWTYLLHYLAYFFTCEIMEAIVVRYQDRSSINGGLLPIAAVERCCLEYVIRPGRVNWSCLHQSMVHIAGLDKIIKFCCIDTISEIATSPIIIGTYNRPMITLSIYSASACIRKSATCLVPLEDAWAAWPSISRSTKQHKKQPKGFFFSAWWLLKKVKFAFPS